jgi:hypothetical protein
MLISAFSLRSIAANAIFFALDPARRPLPAGLTSVIVSLLAIMEPFDYLHMIAQPGQLCRIANTVKIDHHRPREGAV